MNPDLTKHPVWSFADADNTISRILEYRGRVHLVKTNDCALHDTAAAPPVQTLSAN